MIMNKPFLSTVEILLTPLSPFHIGCDEVYEPVNFVVENGLLYGFESDDVTLPKKLRAELQSLAGAVASEDAGICQIARFFDKNKSYLKPFARSIVPIEAAPFQKFRNLLAGDKGPDLKTIAQGRIEKTAYIRKEGFTLPYVPGSSLKGSLHTALLDRVHQARGIGKISKGDGGLGLDKVVLGSTMNDGTMNLSPMRLISVSDLIPTSDNVTTRITMGRRVSKKQPLTEPFSEGISAAFEVVEKAQFQAFRGSVTLRQSHGLPGEPDPNLSYCTVNDIFSDLNRFSRSLLNSEQSYWEVSPDTTASWFARVSDLLESIKPEMDAGKVALVRLGKNTGAENITLREKDVARIKILLGDGKSIELDHATTRFIAYEESPEGEMPLPFGWVLLEAGETRATKLIEKWCRESSIFNCSFDPVKARENFKADKERIQRLVESEREADKARKTLSKERREIMDLADKLKEASASETAPGKDLYQKTIELLAKAGSWSVPDRKYAAEQLGPEIKSKKMTELGNKEKRAKLKELLRNCREAV